MKPTLSKEKASLAHREESWLARNGGSVLALAGIAQIALAAVFRHTVTVAPLFAFLGVVCLVLGVVLHRAVGEVEISTKRFRFFLAELASRPELRHVSAEVFVEGLEAALEVSEPSETPALEQGIVEGVVKEVAATQAMVLNADEEVKRWLEGEDWLLERMPPGGFAYDFTARRGDEILYVAVKASRRPVTDDQISQVILMATFMPSVVARQTRFALIIVGSELTQAALARIRGQNLIEVYVMPETGTFERIE
jgi:hypothetical protein